MTPTTATGVTRYLTSKVPIAQPDDTLADVLRYIQDHIRDLDTLNYIYVVNKDGKLLNAVSIKELYARKLATKIRDVPFPKKLHTLKEHADRERAIYLALQHNIKAVPIVSRNGRFLGIIPADAIHRILFSELREDLMRFAGIRHADSVVTGVLQMPVFVSLRHRLPWLLLGLAGGLLSAGIVDLFENTLRQALLLAAFLPLVVFVNNAVAIQMTAYLIRDLSADSSFPFRRYFVRELHIAVLLAICCSVLLWAVSLLLYQDSYTSGVLGLTLFCGIISAIITGVVFPYAFHRMKLDPADASGPIGTIVQDNLSIIIYFIIAAALL